MKKVELEYRMYGLVNYQLAGTIHAGIQYGHAVVEYAQRHFKDKEYQEWSKKHKTFIILNGGNTRTHGGSTDSTLIGTMQQHEILLMTNKIKYARFCEPDLNDALTAIVFLVDERVFNKEKYPFDANQDMDDSSNKEWIKSLGGKQNIFLREFLSNFKLL